MIAKMELCTARGISKFPLVWPKHLASMHIQSINCRTQFPFNQEQLRFNSGAGSRYHINSSIRSTTSEETSTEASQYESDETESETDGRIVVEDTRPDEKKGDYDTQPNDTPQEGSLIVVEDTRPDEKKGDFDTQPDDTPQEGSLIDSLQLFKFFEDLDIKFDYEESYSILVFGGGGAVALWLAAAIVGAIDSIPVFPKVLELIGLGYTIWFTSRYLIFKESRDELVARIEQIKEEVLGAKDG